jgi:hypothetical protein
MIVGEEQVYGWFESVEEVTVGLQMKQPVIND